MSVAGGQKVLFSKPVQHVHAFLLFSILTSLLGDSHTAPFRQCRIRPDRCEVVSSIFTSRKHLHGSSLGGLWPAMANLTRIVREEICRSVQAATKLTTSVVQRSSIGLFAVRTHESEKLSSSKHDAKLGQPPTVAFCAATAAGESESPGLGI